MPAFNLALPSSNNKFIIAKKCALQCIVFIGCCLFYHHGTTTLLTHWLQQKTQTVTQLRNQLSERIEMTHKMSHATDHVDIANWLTKREHLFKRLLSLSTSSVNGFCLTSMQLNHREIIVSGNSVSASAFTNALMQERFMKQFGEILVDVIEPVKSKNYVKFRVRCRN